MKLFDLHLDASQADRNAFDNLTFFGMSGALVLPPPTSGRAGAGAIRHALDRHVARTRLLARLSGASLVAAGAVRVVEGRVRAVDEAFEHVEALAEAGQIAAIAPVRIDEVSTQHGRANLEVGAVVQLPTLLWAGPGCSPTTIRKALEVAVAAGVLPSRIAVGGLDHIAIRPVIECGALAAIGVGQGGLAPLDVVDLAGRFDRAAWPHLALGSMARRGPPDVLALPRAGEALACADLPAGAAAAICWRNAHRWLGLPVSPSAFDVSAPR